MRGVSFLAIVGAATLFVAASGTPHGTTDGGTFRMAVPAGWFDAVDPALTGLASDILRPVCASLMSFPHRPLPAGLRTAPELARTHPSVSKDGRTYTFVIRDDARFSTGVAVTSRDVIRSLERVFTPAMESPAVEFLGDIVGASEMLAGKTKSLRGVTAKGRRLTFRLTKRSPSFPARLVALCIAPANLPIDPEGARAPIRSPAPYYVSEYEPGRRAVLERNRFYRGPRPHHVDRFTIEIDVGVGAVDRVMRGELDHIFPSPDLNGRLREIARRFGVNRSRFFVEPATFTRMFFLNTSRPLFKDNLRLRKAMNYAVDRQALTREVGPHVATATDQYLPTALAGFRDARIYPLAGPDLRRARALAEGRTRSGKAVLYTCNRPDCLAPAEILRRNFGAIGIQVRIRPFPTRDAAPAIAYATLNAWAFVSARTGCVVMNPFLDLTAVCLK